MTVSQHLAEFNIGALRYDWDDPRMKDFEAVERLSYLAEHGPSARAFGWDWVRGCGESPRAEAGVVA